MTVAGWFDADDLAGPFKTFHAIENFNPGLVNTLVVGPWIHGGWAHNDGDQVGDVEFGSKTSLFFRREIQFPFFEHYLKDKGSIALPKAYVFETGANVWRKYDAWPPKNAVAKMLYLHAGGRLSFDPPVANEIDHDQYVSDPADPVPFVNHPISSVQARYMDDDQRFTAHRPDVLVYQTEPLTADLTLVGPVSPRLCIASTGTDSDFIVKLIDVYPNDHRRVTGSDKLRKGPSSVRMAGYQKLVRGEPMRAKFRDSWERPEPLTPGRITTVNFSMPDINHTFLKGHRIMVQIQSSWFPLTDRNPQTFTDIPFAKPAQFVKATESIYHSPSAATGLEVLVVP
jgi:putative CocE/NonD family hydrolase